MFTFLEIQVYPSALYLYLSLKLTFFLQIYLSYVNDMRNISYTQAILAQSLFSVPGRWKGNLCK